MRTLVDVTSNIAIFAWCFAVLVFLLVGYARQTFGLVSRRTWQHLAYLGVVMALLGAQTWWPR